MQINKVNIFHFFYFTKALGVENNLKQLKNVKFFGQHI